MKKKFFVILGLLVLVSLMIVACGPKEFALGTEENPIIFVLVPSQDTEAVLAGAEDLAAEIEAETGLIVSPLVTTDFSAAVEAMCNGESHIGALNTLLMVMMEQL